MIFGGGLVVLLAVFALLLASIGKIARDRGRNFALWALVGAAAGVAAFLLGIAVFQQAMSDDDSSTTLALLSVLAPLVFMVAAMFGVWMYLQRSRVHVSSRDTWTVHFVSRGDGVIEIGAEDVRFEWPDGSRSIRRSEIERVEADGECVRITAPELELAALPTGTPNTPDGRREQSQALARRLRMPLPLAATRT